MSEEGRNWYLDLVVVAVLTALAGAAIFAGIGGIPRIAIGLPLIVFLPGYALTAVLFPAREEGGGVEPFDDGKKGLRSPLPRNHQIDGTERLALSVSLSVAVVPAVAFAANFTEWGINPQPILFGLVGVTIMLVLVAFALRSRLPAERRYAVSYRPFRSRMGPSDSERTPLDSGGGRNRILNGVVALSMILFVASVGFAIAYPQEGENFTEFYVQTDDVTGDTTSLHNSSYTQGESQPLTVAIENHEHEDQRYTVVAELQQVQYASNVTVQEREELTRADATVASGATRNLTLDIEPTFEGMNLRLQLYLYKGDAPANPAEESAYTTLSLWITVDSGGNADLREPPTLDARANGGLTR